MRIVEVGLVSLHLCFEEFTVNQSCIEFLRTGVSGIWYESIISLHTFCNEVFSLSKSDTWPCSRSISDESLGGSTEFCD